MPKKRIHEEQIRREAEAKEAAEKRAAAAQTRACSGVDVGRTSLGKSRETASANIEASRNARKH